jgi:hypothetical protein
MKGLFKILKGNEKSDLRHFSRKINVFVFLARPAFAAAAAFDA